MAEHAIGNPDPTNTHQDCHYRVHIQEQLQGLEGMLGVAEDELKRTWGTPNQYEPEHAVRHWLTKKNMVEAVLAACENCHQETKQQECPAALELIRVAIST